jgi:serralysin
MNMPTIIGTSGNDAVGVLSGGGSADIILGLQGNDDLYGANGADFLLGGAGDDEFFYFSGGETSDGLGAFDYIEGGDGIDAINVSDSVQFTDVSISSIERLTYTDNPNTDFRFITVSASQIGGGQLASNLLLTGAADTDVFQINMGSTTYLDLTDFTFASWTSGASVFGGDRVQINGDDSSETIVGTVRNDYIEGGLGNDRLYGYLAADTLLGGDGNDVLYGGLGLDTISTGAGSDIVMFETAPSSATNFDDITDFSVPLDTIWMKKSIFTGLGALGTLTADQFKTIGIAGASVDASDRVIYDRSTGFLYYDMNGSAAGGAAKIAEMATGLIVTNADFFVYA